MTSQYNLQGELHEQGSIQNNYLLIIILLKLQIAEHLKKYNVCNNNNNNNKYVKQQKEICLIINTINK